MNLQPVAKLYPLIVFKTQKKWDHSSSVWTKPNDKQPTNHKQNNNIYKKIPNYKINFQIMNYKLYIGTITLMPLL